MQIETIDVTTIGELSEDEIDVLLEHSINPRMPIEIFYAVLDRIGGIPAAAAPPAPLEEPFMETQYPGEALTEFPGQYPAEFPAQLPTQFPAELPA
jgi:hypothetical protein